jgi:hypothetical protein
MRGSRHTGSPPGGEASTFATSGERRYGSTLSSLLQALSRFIPALGDLARRSWCRAQRQRLVGVTTTVLWVPPDKVRWAVWGAEHQFFDAEWAGTLLYLRSR